MATSGSPATILERIEAVSKELQALTIEAQESEKARKALMAISQQTVNALELGPDAIWRLIMQVHNRTHAPKCHFVRFHGPSRS